MKILLHILIFLALVAGFVVGLLFESTAIHLKILGDLFIRLLKMLIIPLVMASMISGIVSIPNLRSLGRIGARTFVYYLTTTVLAILVGLFLVNLIQPGSGVEAKVNESFEASDYTPSSVSSIVMDIIPDNIFGAMARMDILPVIFFSILFGIALLAVREKASPVIKFFEGLDAAMMKLTGWIMYLAPVGVFGLMAYTVGKMGMDILAPLAKYIGTVITGLLIHACITLPLLLVLFGKLNPLKFFGHLFTAVTTAFSTASSAATLPISIESLEENAGVSSRITSFVMPLGATVNMDGTALYEAVAAMFIAQVYGIQLGLQAQFLIVLTATLASIGAAAIPNAGLITLVIVLRAVNLPLEGIGMILAVDRILDMCRTAVNVWGDSCGAAIVARLSGETFSAKSPLKI